MTFDNVFCRTFSIKRIFIHRLVHDSLEYYITLQSESHREAWSNVLISMFTKFLKLDEDQVKFKRIISILYFNSFVF